MYRELIPSLYIHRLAPIAIDDSNSKDSKVKVLPLSRNNFVKAAFTSTAFLIYEIVLFPFRCLQCLATCFCNKEYNAKLKNNCANLPFFLAIGSVGFLGTIFPETINVKMLGIPKQGLLRERSAFQDRLQKA